MIELRTTIRTKEQTGFIAAITTSLYQVTCCPVIRTQAQQRQILVSIFFNDRQEVNRFFSFIEQKKIQLRAWTLHEDTVPG